MKSAAQSKIKRLLSFLHNAATGGKRRGGGEGSAHQYTKWQESDPVSRDGSFTFNHHLPTDNVIVELDDAHDSVSGNLEGDT